MNYRDKVQEMILRESNEIQDKLNETDFESEYALTQELLDDSKRRVYQRLSAQLGLERS